MKVNLDFRHSLCTITREPKDLKIYSESRLYYLIKKEVQRQGHDVIKKLMGRDGHLVDDKQYYIRERKWKFALRDLNFSLRQLQEDYNQGECTLHIHQGENWA